MEFSPAAAASLAPTSYGQRNVPRGASVLVVDDSPAIRAALTHTLGTLGMFDRIETAADGFAAYQMLLTRSFDIVLCDLNMPRCDGIGFLRLRATNAALHGLPVLVLTGSTDNDSKISALELGACDYVGKAAAPAELGARLAVHLRLKQTHDDLIRKTAELERMCNTDSLTGLSNRRYLREALDLELSRSARYGRTVSFAMIDVDHFKQLNDTYGHQAGDHVLVRLSALLMQSVRKNDIVGRYGGEEIALILPETGLHGARILAERIRIAIAEQRIVWERELLNVTVSIGLASISVGQSETAEGLIRAADRALYRAKNAGRNCVVLAGTDTTPFLAV
jgi:two-component system cell cycle response regulator